ncbi:MAG: SPOR domain-containing protein [Treponema sp.]|jgi:hypothetical protein|nr:SPOR domain-containing protein [Treponema sp.]
MRKETLLAIIGISLFMLVGASVWEGAAELGGDLPETGLYIATNSLPINTVVDVTNLENGQFAQLVVSSGLNSSGFLALLSKDAANALGIEKDSLSRIRLSQNPDPLAFSRFIVDPGTRTEYEDFTLIPDVPRPPEGTPVLDQSLFVPSYTPPPQESPQPQPQIEASYLIEPVPVIPAAPSVSVFSAPIISALEKGMYYVQVAAYRNKESVEYEITRRIGKDFPVVIEINPDSVGDPIYRVLIGPVSFEQSAEILERYRTTFNDAIVRRGT